jgi:hypothetical protein
MKISIQAAVVDVGPWGDNLWLPTLMHGVGLYASTGEYKNSVCTEKDQK